MEYRILESTSRVDLERQINGHLDDGWQLSGGVAISRQPDENRGPILYAQAVTIKDETKPRKNS